MSTVAVSKETSTAVGSSCAPNCPSTIRTGDLVVDLNTRVVAVNDKPVHLTGKEYGILELFSLRKGTTLTKEMFLNHLYGGMDEPELKIIDVFVCKLRKKLAQATGGYHYIETIWGRGYVLRDPAPTPAVTLAVGAEDRDARNDETGSCLTERFETAASHRRAAPVAPQRRQRHGGLRRSLPRGTRFSL